MQTLNEILSSVPSTTGKRKRNVYFPKEVQDAIIKHNELLEEGESELQRRRLFDKHIYPALFKLSENLINMRKIRKYETTFKDLQRDTVAFLYSKLPGYKEEKGKAYSYFTIICNHFLIYYSQERANELKRNSSNELELGDSERDIVSEVYEENRIDNLREFINYWCNWVESNYAKLFKSKKEISVAGAIIDLFRNSEDIEIYNKKFLYVVIREQTNESTLIITKVTTKMREYFYNMYNQYNKLGYFTAPVIYNYNIVDV